MQLVQVDGLYAQAAQRCVECPMQVPARKADVVDVRSRAKASLSGQYDPIDDFAGSCLQPPTDNLLGYTAHVDIGSIDQIATSRDEGIEDLEGLFFRCFVTEVHRAEAERGDHHACIAEFAVSHCLRASEWFLINDIALGAYRSPWTMRSCSR